MDIWSFDLITESLSWWRIACTTNQENQLKIPSIQINEDEYNKDKKFSPKITSPALELMNNKKCEYWPSITNSKWSPHLNGIGSVLTFFQQISFFFCYSWFRLQSIAIHCNRRCVWREHPHTRLFRDTIILWHTSQCDARCRTTCLHKNMFIHMSSHVSAFDVSLFCLLPLSLVSLLSLPLLPVLCFELQPPWCRDWVLNPMRTEKWGVLPRGDIQPSHTMNRQVLISNKASQ